MSSNQKHTFNFESITIKGNIGSDILLKTKAKERLEFFVAVNKYNKETQKKTAKWFKVVVFDDELIVTIKNNTQFYKRGTNIKVRGEIQAETYKDKTTLKIIARQIGLNIPPRKEENEQSSNSTTQSN